MSVSYEIGDGRGGRHARLHGQLEGKLVCNIYVGALFETGITEGGCIAHARCKFHDLGVNHSSRLPARR